ncbi:MAG TPA: ligase [Chloroflexota bacterium]|nr:ligase [Chloroflexota bacterium]
MAESERLRQEVAAGEAPATLRWYGYDAPGLVLGVSQDLSDVNLHACEAARIVPVKRTSGGKAVLVNQWAYALDVALPAGSALALADVVEAYRWIGETFLEVLHGTAPAAAERIGCVSPAEARLDQEAQRASAPESPNARRALACFGTLSPYEVVTYSLAGDSAGKLIGLSQIRKRGIVLHQVGLYARPTGAELAGLLAVPPEQRPALAAELNRRISSLEAIGLSAGDVAQLMEGFNRRAPSP